MNLAPVEPSLELLTDLLNVDGEFRDQDAFCSAGHTDGQGQMSFMPSHGLDNENALMRGGRITKLVHSLDACVHGGIETDCVVGIRDIVIYRARYPYGSNSSPAELVHAPEAAVAADDYYARESRTPDTGCGQVLPFRKHEAI